MRHPGALTLFSCLMASLVFSQTSDHHPDFKLAFPDHKGRLEWTADGFRTTEMSAKPNGNEIGVRGTDASHGLTFLAFLFLVPGEEHLSNARCREQALAPEQKNNPTFKVLARTEMAGSNGRAIAVETSSAEGAGGKPIYSVRSFVAAADLCGDIEFYGDSPVIPADPTLRKILASYELDPDYMPEFKDTFLHAQILYQQRMYGAAAPAFEEALAKLKDDKNQEIMKRVTTDQAGMAYGMSGNIAKARAIFAAAIAKDPSYPMYYYNLACADAEEKKLGDARIHLQEAFNRKSNVIPGEAMPDPTKDDSFLPYKNDKAFWSFIQSLH